MAYVYAFMHKNITVLYFQIDVRAEFLYQAVWLHALVLNSSLTSFNGIQPTDEQLNRQNIRLMRSWFDSGENLMTINIACSHADDHPINTTTY